MERARRPRGVAQAANLVAAAEQELIERDGVLEVASVAARAGVSTGALYHHFGSKAGLVTAVTEAFYARHHEQVIAPALEDAGTWAERERLRTGLTVAFHYDDPFAPIVLARLAREPEIAATEAPRLSTLIEAAAQNLARAQAAGEVDPGLDCDLAGAIIIGGTRQALGSALARDPRPPRELVADAIWRMVAAAVRR